MTTRWNRVTIIGCGLLGASFALALRRASACAQNVRDELRECSQRGGEVEPNA